MGTLKGTAEKAIGKIREVVADIAGDGKLSEQDKAEQQLAEESKNDSGRLNPLGNLNRLT
jgi:uncharacterized protein YjbJ (UPF0337 family)